MSYDTWLTDPYELHYEEARKEEEEREWILEQIDGMDEDEIEDFLFEHRLDDPR